MQDRQKLQVNPISVGCLCNECPFAINNLPSNPVWGSGPVVPLAVFVGESPGEDETIEGKPFVGRTGQALDLEFEAVGLDRSKLFIVNACLCKPNDKTGRRMKRAVQCCKPAFEFQIGKFRDNKHFFAAGKWAAYAVFGKTVSLTKGRGFIRKLK